MKKILLILAFLLFVQKSFSDELEDELTVEDEDYFPDPDMEMEMPEEPEEEIVEIEQPAYDVPSGIEGAFLFENFQTSEHVQNHWTHSSKSEFSGRFAVGTGGSNPSLDAENGLFVPREAQRYAIFGSLASPFDFKTQKSFIVQYEVRLHEALQCGGAYIKLASKQGDEWQPEDVTNETPYTVMFGPDKCGGTNKVHFIWKFQNPVTKEYKEHHLASPPTPVGTSDKMSHIYTLVIRADNTFEVFIDQDSKKKGSLLTDFEPPLVPAKQIDDPEDSKPEDWVDEEKIPEPDAVKPDDWDEDAPRRIIDAEATMPEGWEEDEPQMVADPDASEPEDWDEEDDGEWEAPVVDNPKCSVGCGEWEPPMIDNPDYKGKWYPPMIDNPDYIGEFVPKQIDNPEYFDEDSPFQKLNSVAGVVIDIWTMQKGIEYDNIYVGNSEDAAYELSRTWEIRRDFQKKSMKSSFSSDSDASDIFGDILTYVQENVVAVVATVLLLLFTIVYFCCCGSDAPEARMAEVQEHSEEEEAEDEKVEEKDEAPAPENKKDPALTTTES